MNKVVLMGRLVRDPEIRYSQGPEQIAVGRYTLAVNRRSKEKEADFISCVVFGKAATFAEKYFVKGQMVAVVGRLQVRSWEDKSGNKRWTTEVLVEEQHFCGSKKESESSNTEKENDGFYPIDELEDDDLPF